MGVNQCFQGGLLKILCLIFSVFRKVNNLSTLTNALIEPIEKNEGANRWYTSWCVLSPKVSPNGTRVTILSVGAAPVLNFRSKCFPSIQRAAAFGANVITCLLFRR